MQGLAPSPKGGSHTCHRTHAARWGRVAPPRAGSHMCLGGAQQLVGADLAACLAPPRVFVELCSPLG